jgi:outer membrane protein assembly factor BamD (BamD/ComL family)
MKIKLLALVSGLCLLIGAIGCSSKDASKASDSQDKLFTSANPAIKELWTKGKMAIKANDYLGASGLLNQLQAQTELNPDQAKAVTELVTSFNTAMFAAADKGDTNALKAIQELRSRSRR